MEAFFQVISNGGSDKLTEEQNNKLARDYGMQNVGPRSNDY
jgi:hypothetical protein